MNIKFEIRLIVFYLTIKFILVASLISVFDLIFSQSYFNYPDFDDYSDFNVRSHNGLFSVLLFNISVNDISQPLAIFLAFFLNSFKDLFILLIARSVISKRATVLFCLFLSLHPYLAVYHAKFTTDIFAGLAVTFLFFKCFKKFQSPWIELVIVFLLSGLRNSTIPMLGVFSALNVVRQFLAGDLKKSTIYFMCGLSAVFFLFLPEENYSKALVNSAKEYPFNIMYFQTIFDLGSGLLATAISAILVLVSHTVLLLGFREAVYIDFPEIFLPFTPIIGIQVFVFISMFFVHIIGLVYFFLLYLREQKDLVLLLLIVFPGFLLVAHLRYFLPLIPIALWGFALFSDACLARMGAIMRR